MLDGEEAANGFRGRGRGSGRQFQDHSTIECYKCHKLGHYQYECQSVDKVASYAEYDETEELLLMLHEESQDTKLEVVWFLDSGCSNHMCGIKSAFSELDDAFRHVVKLGNNTRMEVFGRGSVKLNMNGIVHVISEVCYVPELRNNLLSLGQLQEKGLAILIQPGVCKIFHPSKGLIIQTNMSPNRMFALTPQVQHQKSSCFNTTAQDVTHLWHCRYGHINFKGLQELQKKEMVSGLPKMSDMSNVCADCMKGKQHREPFPKQSQ